MISDETHRTEYVCEDTGDERAAEIFYLSERFKELCKQVYKVYSPLVDNLCIKEASEDEVEQLLDYLMDFACDEKIFELFKKISMRYLDVYPECIKFYIEEYRELWYSESEPTD